MTKIEIPFKERYVTSQDNLRLYFREYGDPYAKTLPILCLPGLTRNSKDFHNVAAWLSQEHRVICPDYRGRGKSEYDKNWRNYRAPIYLQDLSQIIMACHFKKMIVIGTSMGGLLAMGLNILKPGLVRAAVINDIGPRIQTGGLGRILNYIGTDKPLPNWQTAIEHLRDLFPNMMLTGETDWQEFAENTFCRKEDGLLHYDWDVKIAKAIKAESGNIPDLWPLFRSLKHKPVLVVRGGVSDILKESTVQEMKQVLPHIENITVPNVGHAPTLFERESKEAILDFIEKVEQKENPSDFKTTLREMMKKGQDFFKRA